MKHISLSRLYIVITAIFMSLCYVNTAASDATCGSVTEASADVSLKYTPKFLSSKPKDEDIAELQDMAIKAAWEEYVSSCMNQGRIQQYLAKKDMIVMDLAQYVSVVAFEHEKHKNKKNVLNGRIVIRVKTNMVDALFAQQAGTVGGRGIRMMWLFTTSQTTFQQDSTLQALAPTVDNRSSTKSLDTLDNTYQSDGTNTVESTLTESMTQSKSSGSVTTGGNISTLGTTQISVNDKINAVFGVSMKQGLTKNNFRPTQYDYVAARCGGVNPRDIEKDIAMNGVMSMENLISVENAALDCRMELMAIGTIDIGIPKPSTVSGYSVAVSVTGEIIDLRDGMPFSIAAFGPVQQNDGGVDEATAIRNAIANAGTKTAIELANILDANGIR